MRPGACQPVVLEAPPPECASVLIQLVRERSMSQNLAPDILAGLGSQPALPYYSKPTFILTMALISAVLWGEVCVMSPIGTTVVRHARYYVHQPFSNNG